MQMDGGHGCSGGAEGGGGGTGEGVKVGWGQPPPPFPFNPPLHLFVINQVGNQKTKFINQQESPPTIPLEIRYHKQIGHLRKPME